MTAQAVPVLATRDVRLIRDQQVVLDGVDWKVGQGEHWVVVGANGAGKSTLLELASTYEIPSRGTIDVLGHRVGRGDLRDLQTFGEDERAEAKGLLAELGLDALDDRPTGQLSEGERQRVQLLMTEGRVAAAGPIEETLTGYRPTHRQTRRTARASRSPSSHRT